MLRNAVASISAVWLFIAPVLCAGGVIVHPCECTDGVEECGACCAESDGCGCGCLDHGCSHDGCDQDPCRVTVTTEKEGRTRVHAPLAAGLVRCRLRLFASEPFESRSVPPPRAPGRRESEKNLPYPPSDAPRLN